VGGNGDSEALERQAKEIVSIYFLFIMNMRAVPIPHVSEKRKSHSARSTTSCLTAGRDKCPVAF
jgi:hypothetical protein